MPGVHSLQLLMRPVFRVLEMALMTVFVYTAYGALLFSVNRVLLVAWLSGNTLVSINVVTLRRARLVLGWVTL